MAESPSPGIVQAVPSSGKFPWLVLLLAFGAGVAIAPSFYELLKQRRTEPKRLATRIDSKQRAETIRLLRAERKANRR